MSYLDYRQTEKQKDRPLQKKFNLIDFIQIIVKNAYVHTSNMNRLNQYL